MAKKRLSSPRTRKPGAPRTASPSVGPTAKPKVSRPTAAASAAQDRDDAPSAPSNPFPIVGVGASAGGLDAFRRFLTALPSDTGMAYVLVQHLDPRHESILAALLARTTRMPVAEVTADVKVKPDHVYIIPPPHDIAITDGTLRLVPRSQTGGQHMPIDLFMRTLADVQASKAIGVVLSGTASDGTLGLKAIKAEGGIAFAQEPESAQYDGMPRSAIASGAVDVVLPPEGIARELARLGRHAHVAPEPVSERAEAPEADGLKRVLLSLKKATGTDFRFYKSTTIKRRITRRMALKQIQTVDEYARHLESNLDEVGGLYQDCLISVTSFFRDPEAFDVLSQKVLPRLLKGRPADAPIRVWVPGCATGEEVYSIAICLLERAGELASNPAVQVFATDLSEAALQKARAGVYLDSIAQEVSAERLRRFFSPVDGHYQVSKSVREMCVFAHHDLLKDPPFSKMDLVSCRNLLIYLEPDWQQKVLAAFQYALQPTGLLMIGSSENLGAAADLFTPFDRKHRIFAKNPSFAPRGFLAGGRRREGQTDVSNVARLVPRSAGRSDVAREADRVLLSRYAPGGVVLDEDLRIVEFRGDTAAYLEHPQGAASLNILKMVRKGVLPHLREAVEEARRTGGAAHRRGLRVRRGAEIRGVDLEVIPIKTRPADRSGFLVLFHEEAATRGRVRPETSEPKPATRDGKDREIGRLRKEVAEANEYLQALTQEHDAANEELQATNEDALSANEELQSINEELQTAKEEVQSANEELATLNQELLDRNREVALVNDDLMNLLASLNIPIAMVGGDMRLRRFTPSAEKLLNLIPTDVGRPLGNLRPNLEISDLQEEVRKVIDTMDVVDREVKDSEGRSYAIRIRPYQTAEKKIDGAVLILIDIDALKRSAEEAQRALEYASAIVQTVREPLLILDGSLRVESANQAFYATFGMSPENTEGRLLYELGDREWDIPPLRTLLEEILTRDTRFEEFDVDHTFPRIGRRRMVLNARRLRYPDDLKGRILLAIEDQTDTKHAQEDRERLLTLEQQARGKAEDADRVKDEFVATVSHELRGPLNAMVGWIHVLLAGGLDPAIQSRGLAALDRGIRAQARLVEDLLDYSRMVTGKLRLSHGLVDVVPVAEAALESLRPAAEAKDIKVTFSSGPPARILGDPGRLEQVVWNLVSNAIKFTPRGGEVDVHAGRVGTEMHVVVRDTGTGIPSDFLPHAFERFRQADGTATRSQGGLGLGLAIVRQVVELHGGTVRAESAGDGKGSTFTVVLPIPALLIERRAAQRVERASHADSVQGTAWPDVDRTLLQGLRVLVVEDDAESRDILVTVLEMCGAAVTATASAADAMAALQAAVPDVMIADIGMTGADGYELIRRVRRRSQADGGAVPALALTAYAGPDDRARAMAAGFHGHLAKPAAPADLVGKVAALVGRASGSR